QPKVILTNVLRTKIGRKYIDSHVIIDANLSAADKLQSGQLPSSSVASLQTCQILSSPHESSFLSESKYPQEQIARNIGEENSKRRMIWIEELTRRGAMLDLVLTNKEGLVGNVKLKGNLGCSDHEM
ncbi:PREDICTED: sentrin-specific protease 7-like, partial [Cariama cristata]|uniref:sentrin-specific protease 7-like n=1 Tax=Cariama cristata TaxID=54380 RepID=UPI000520B1BD